MWKTSKVCDSQITDLSQSVTTNSQGPLLCHSVRPVWGSWLIDKKFGNTKFCLWLVRTQTQACWVASPGLTVLFFSASEKTGRAPLYLAQSSLRTSRSQTSLSPRSLREGSRVQLPMRVGKPEWKSWCFGFCLFLWLVGWLVDYSPTLLPRHLYNLKKSVPIELISKLSS